MIQRSPRPQIMNNKMIFSECEYGNYYYPPIPRLATLDPTPNTPNPTRILIKSTTVSGRTLPGNQDFMILENESNVHFQHFENGMFISYI